MGGCNIIKKCFLLKCIYKFNEIGIKIPTGIFKNETKSAHGKAKEFFFFFFLCGENQSIEWMCKIKIFLTVEIKADSVDKMIEK